MAGRITGRWREIMIKIILPLVAMLALGACKKKDDDTGSDELNTEMSEQE